MFESLISKLRESESVEYPETEEKFLKRVLSEKLVNTYYGKKIIEQRINKIEKDNTKNIRRSFTRQKISYQQTKSIQTLSFFVDEKNFTFIKKCININISKLHSSNFKKI